MLHFAGRLYLYYSIINQPHPVPLPTNEKVKFGISAPIDFISGGRLSAYNKQPLSKLKKAKLCWVNNAEGGNYRVNLDYRVSITQAVEENNP